MDDEQGACSVLEDRLRDTSAVPTDLPLSLFKSITKDFSEELQIGAGGFGVVYKGVLRNGVVAVKKLSDQLIEDKPFIDEVACLMRTKHKNTVRFLGYCADTQGKIVEHEGRYVLADVRVRLLCFEYIDSGSLRSRLTDECDGLEWHVRYRIIEGVCQGLRYLHQEEKIVHLDLKPENILLDSNMVPKISDFGLSRLFDKEQTRAITSNHWGTKGYVAPEYLDHGLITLKSDIYSLGVIILEIVTGKRTQPKVENVHENWKNRLQTTFSHSSLEAYCQQVKRCVEIALNCTEVNSKNRPTIGEIINKLSETETAYQEKETATTSELLGIQPLELKFPFKPNELIPCPLHLTNHTDHRVAFRLHPRNPERYFTEWLCGVVPPRATYTLIVMMKEQQQPPLDQDEFLMEQSRIMYDEKLKEISQGAADDEFDNFFIEVEEMGADRVHELKLMAVCGPQAETTSEVISMLNLDKMVSMDVHPSKPWVVTGHFNGHVCIWNYQTKAMINSFEVTKEQEVLTVKFIAHKHWVVAGGGDYCIHVYSYKEMKIVKKFEALTEQITSLAIHPTEPYVLSASYDFEIKLWNWENGWRSSRKFKEEHSDSVMQVVFNAKDAKAFASASKDMTLKIWSVDSPRSKVTLAGHTSIVKCLDYFTRGDKQYLITGSDDGTAKIWDLQKKSCVETLKGHANRVNAVCSHPELPILLTGSRDGTVRLWNSNTFRLEGVLNFGLRKVQALTCMKGSRRVVIGYSNGLAITEIDNQGPC
uniref:Protein kinase domain-containing protein n=1 Tax=Arundo donax TaxID=35708 RepID=A0A0A9BN88_ARUDO